jgi:hypothetical protein
MGWNSIQPSYPISGRFPRSSPFSLGVGSRSRKLPVPPGPNVRRRYAISLAWGGTCCSNAETASLISVYLSRRRGPTQPRHSMVKGNIRGGKLVGMSGEVVLGRRLGGTIPARLVTIAPLIRSQDLTIFVGPSPCVSNDLENRPPKPAQPSNDDGSSRSSRSLVPAPLQHLTTS